MHTAPSLPELQHRFADTLLGVTQAVPGDWIVGNGLAPAARVQIYRNLVFNNHAAALRTAYPVVAKLVGEDFFDAAAARYLHDHGSDSGNLQDYGAGFPEFLVRMPEAANLAYLPEVARLEWARQESYLAADAAPLDPKALTTMSKDIQAELKLRLHPSLRLVTSAHPIWDIWMFCQETSPDQLELSSDPQTVLVWRDADQVAMQLASTGRRDFLAALLTHESLAAAYEQAAAHEADFYLSTCLHWLLDAGLVTGFCSN